MRFEPERFQFDVNTTEKPHALILTLRYDTSRYHEARLPLVAGRNGWLEAELKKNPLLKTQRRRGDANVVWDFRPIDKTAVNAVLDAAKKYFE